MNIHAPQLIFLTLLVLGLGIDLTKHGEEKTGTTNFGLSLISASIIIGILYWGGFFNQIN